MKQIRYSVLALLVAIACLLSGCGGQEGQRMGVDGYVYATVILERGNNWNIYRRNFSACGDYLYYMEGSSTLKRIPLEEACNGLGLIGGEPVLTVSEILQTTAEGRKTERDFSKADIRDYVVEPDGSIYCILAADDATDGISSILNGSYDSGEKGEASDISSAWGLLYKRAPEGETAYWMELPELRVLSPNPDWLAIDSKRNAYVLTAEAILIVDAGGRITGSLPVELADNIEILNGTNGRLLEGNNGQVYYIAETVGIGNPEIFRIDNGDNLRMTNISLPSVRMQTGIYEGVDCLLKTSSDSLFRYDEAEGSLVKILQWADSGLLGSDVMSAVQIDADHYLATISADASCQNILLTKTPADKLPEKEIIVIASLSPAETLRHSIVEFNRSNEKYHIILETYSTDNDYDEEADTRLDSSLLSRNAPDILDLFELDVNKYANKGMLEDLNSYMKDELVINQKNYLSNLLDAYTIDGKLVSIPRGFGLKAIFGIAPESCAIENWTMQDLMTLTQRNPAKRLFLYQLGDTYLLKEFCAAYYLKQFVDWEKGECSFDSKEFYVLLDWVNAQNQKDNQAQDALFFASYLRFFDEYLHEILFYGENTTMYGYPSAEGNGSYTAYTLDALGILSSSQHKEGAWEFLRFFLTEETETYWFPTRIDLLKKAYQDAITPGMSPRTLYVNGKPLEYDAMEPEQADTVMQVLESIDFTPRSNAENSIVEIVWEEAQYLFGGSKTSEEVAHTIQNRVSLLLHEIRK